MKDRHSVPLSNVRPVTRKDFSNTAFEDGAQARPDRLHGRGQAILQAVLSKLIASSFQVPCTLEQLSVDLGTTPASIRLGLTGPIALGFVAVERQYIYPSPQLIQQQKPGIGIDEAVRIVQRMRQSVS